MLRADRLLRLAAALLLAPLLFSQALFVQVFVGEIFVGEIFVGEAFVGEALAVEASGGSDVIEPQFRGYSVADIEPHFALTDHAGRRVTEKDYRGEWAVVFFGYSNCSDACPWIFGAVAHAVDLMESRARIRPVFIDFSANPDAPGPLAGMVDALHPRMVGLAGTRRELHQAGRNWKMRRMQRGRRPGEVGLQWHHTTRLYLLNPEGEVAMLIDGMASAEQIAGAMAIAVARSRGEYPSK